VCVCVCVPVFYIDFFSACFRFSIVTDSADTAMVMFYTISYYQNGFGSRFELIIFDEII
jgi:hypothetical protein